MLNNNLENETHQNKVKRLGSHQLKAEFKLNVEEQGDVTVEVNDVRDFINLICKPGGLEELRQNSQFFHKVCWWSEDRDNKVINSLIDYIECLETEDIIDMGEFYGRTNPYSLEKSYDPGKVDKVLLCWLHHHFEFEFEIKPDPETQLLIKKAYMILSLIKVGFCPFKIMDCLKAKANNQNFNWEKIVDVIMKFERSQTQGERNFFSSYACPNRNCEAVHLIKFMYLVQPLLDDNNNLWQQRFAEADVTDTFNFDFTVCDFLFFALSYTRHKQNKAEEDFLSSYATEHWMNKRVADEDRNNLVNNYNNNVLFFLQAYLVFNDSLASHKASCKDFYTLAQNMDPIVFGVFVAMMMRDISFTKKQMEFIKIKINNDAMFDVLKKLNTNLSYKASYHETDCSLDDHCERYVRFSKGSSRLDHALRKVFKGIGYLLFGLSILAVTAIIALPPAVILGILTLVVSMLTTNLIAVLIISELCCGVVCIGLLQFKKIEEFYSNLIKQAISWRASIPETVIKFYDTKIGRLFNLYNLHFPTNDIENPPAIQNIINSVVGNNFETSVANLIPQEPVRPAEQPNINKSQIENRGSAV